MVNVSLAKLFGQNFGVLDNNVQCHAQISFYYALRMQNEEHSIRLRAKMVIAC